MITDRTLCAIAGVREPNDNMRSILAGLDAYGYARLGLDRPHRLAQYLAQIAHESGRFHYDRELWNGQGAQARYDTRTDLGNTPEVDGDGYLYRGRSGIQITGKANYRAFTAWARAIFPDAPDCVADPDLVNTDPWEGLVPLWFWETRRLNDYADVGDIEMITRRINGGLNGFDDRLDLYARAGLVLLGYAPTGAHAFQLDAGLTADGIVGPRTRGALHDRLVEEAAPARAA